MSSELSRPSVSSPYERRASRLTGQGAGDEREAASHADAGTRTTRTMQCQQEATRDRKSVV